MGIACGRGQRRNITTSKPTEIQTSTTLEPTRLDEEHLSTSEQTDHLPMQITNPKPQKIPSQNL